MREESAAKEGLVSLQLLYTRYQVYLSYWWLSTHSDVPAIHSNDTAAAAAAAGGGGGVVGAAGAAGSGAAGSAAGVGAVSSLTSGATNHHKSLKPERFDSFAHSALFARLHSLHWRTDYCCLAVNISGKRH